MEIDRTRERLTERLLQVKGADAALRCGLDYEPFLRHTAQWVLIMRCVAADAVYWVEFSRTSSRTADVQQRYF